jgi:FkbM family methyltransferase
MIHTDIGSATDRDGRPFVSAPANRAGYLLYGPYVRLEPGAYAVTFEILAASDPTTELAVCGRADVVIDEGNRTLAQTALYVPRLLSRSSVTLPFTLDCEAAVEFRIYSTGKIPLTAHGYPALQELSSEETRFCPLFPISYRARNAFLERHIGDFRFLYENGADVIEDERGCIVRFDKVQLLVETEDEFQVINEVFFGKEYNIRTPRRLIFVDVGMNSGFASIFAAAHGNVIKVYGFEPFRTPFQRALANFMLNTAFSTKIEPKNIALSDSNRSIEVLSTSDLTVGTSIKGKTSGVAEVITIREAGPELDEILSEAAFHQCDVVVKLDCEGSEFAIFESLIEYNLLSRISVFMIEWHKWWGADKNEKTLTDPLIKNGFAVFDHTTPGNVYDGMLYAVNTRLARYQILEDYEKVAGLSETSPSGPTFTSIRLNHKHFSFRGGDSSPTGIAFKLPNGIANHLVFGPFVPFPEGRLEATFLVHWTVDGEATGRVEIDVHAAGGTLASRTFTVGPKARRIPFTIEWENRLPRDPIEFRLAAHDSFRGELLFSGVEVRKVHRISTVADPVSVEVIYVPKAHDIGEGRQVKSSGLLRNVANLARVGARDRSATKEKLAAAREHFAKGDRARDETKWELAAREYKLGLERDPQAFAYLIQLGNVLKEAGDPQASEEAYNQAFAMRPTDPDLNLQMGHLYKKTERLAAAEQKYLQSLIGQESVLNAYQELRSLGMTHDGVMSLLSKR